MSSDILIRVDNISKCYQIYNSPHDRLRQFLLPRLKSLLGFEANNYFREFWALKDISFEVKKGETVGIVGRNGSGKSTLLQIICGTLSPSIGGVYTFGRVAALLELGAGFSPEFTGRENIYMAASLYGLTRVETDSRLEQILSFADIGGFIDQPVKTYSSGMFVRLAFSLVAHVDADILVIDEALAVGDVFFQQKCMRFLRGFQKKGGTVLFVTHDTNSVLNLCNKALLLFPHASKPAVFGAVEEICKLYLEDLYKDDSRVEGFTAENHSRSQESYSPIQAKRFLPDAWPETRMLISGFNASSESFGERGAVIVDAGFYSPDGARIDSAKGGDLVTFSIKALVKQRIAWPAFGFMLKNSLGEYLYTEGTDLHFRGSEIVFNGGDIVVASFSFIMPHLIRGRYMLNVALAEGVGDNHIQHHWIHDAVQVDVMSSRLVHGYSGMDNLDMSIEVSPAVTTTDA